MKRPAGFTLFEVLVCLTLVGFLLVSLAGLMNGYGQILRRSAAGERSLWAANTVVEVLGLDLRSAFRIDQPAAGASASQITLQRLNPYASGRFPTPLPDPPPASLDFYRASLRWTIVYGLSQGRLLRTVTPGDGSPAFTSEVAEGLTAFHCERPAGARKLAQVRITLDGQSFRSNVTLAVLP